MSDAKRPTGASSPTQGRPKSGVPPVGEARSASGASTNPTQGRPKSGVPPVGESSVSSTLAPRDLAAITGPTLDHYNQRAEKFWEGTRDHDVAQNIAALLEHIEGAPPLVILDLGCGPGRDLKTFSERGHRAIGLEGAPRFAAMARAYSGCEVWEQDFLHLDLPASYFDGVFANAALFHVPARELPRVLGELFATLKPRGVLFSSNPRGNDDEGWNGGRYGAYHSLETWQRQMTAAGFVELTHYYRPAGLPRDQQPWLASVWRKP